MNKLNVTSIDISFLIILVLSLALFGYSVANEKPLLDISSKEVMSKLNPVSASYSVKELVACEGSSSITKISDRCFVKVLKNASKVNKQNFPESVAKDLLTLSDQFN